MALNLWIILTVAVVSFLAGLTVREISPSITTSSTSNTEVIPSISTAPTTPDVPDVLLESAVPQSTFSNAKFHPNAVTSTLRAHIERYEKEPHLSAATLIDLKTQLCDQLTLTRKFEQAAILRTEMLADRTRKRDIGAADFVLASAAIAQDWQHAMSYEHALSVLGQVPLNQLDVGSKSIITRMEADIHMW